jgi:DNA-binding transcriptional MerR regulator
VGQVAELAGVTIRTLHHYEHIGLLVSSDRSPAGYRIYAETDIDRLSRVLYYRELGFPLDDIATMLDDGGTPAYQHLERQHDLLTERMRRLQAMVAAIEREMEATMGGYNLTPEEKLEVFGDFDPDQYEDEARERWGHTDAWKQSKERARSYTRDDWKRIQAEADDLSHRFVALMQAGTPASSVEAMDLAEEHRQQITRWHYDCSYEIHRGLGEMFVADERFTKNIDQTAPGLAAYMREAFIANADRAEQS